jgi:hypothetical protein
LLNWLDANNATIAQLLEFNNRNLNPNAYNVPELNYKQTDIMSVLAKQQKQETHQAITKIVDILKKPKK